MSFLDGSLDSALAVLIETYWNVNMKSKGKDREIFRGINRNILECKWLPDSQRLRRENQY